MCRPVGFFTATNWLVGAVGAAKLCRQGLQVGEEGLKKYSEGTVRRLDQTAVHWRLAAYLRRSAGPAAPLETPLASITAGQ